MDERRLADRYQEMAVRRQLEMEHNRREQEMARRMQEVREREARYVCRWALLREREGRKEGERG